MKKKIKGLTLIVSISILLISFQNCGDVAFNSSTLSSYTYNVSPMYKGEAKARTGDRIYIASVLASIFLPKGKSVSESEAKAKLGEAVTYFYTYVTSNFENTDKEITNIIKDNILKNIVDFGGNCIANTKDPTCGGRSPYVFVEEQKVNAYAISSASKEGYKIKTCDELISKDRAIENIVFNITGSRTAKMKEEHIQSVYDLFYPYQPVDENAHYRLVDLYNRVSDVGFEKWRAVSLAVCYSTGWQIP